LNIDIKEINFKFENKLEESKIEALTTNVGPQNLPEIITPWTIFSYFWC